MSVTLRDARNSADDRNWIRAVYPDYLSELSVSKTGLFPVLADWTNRGDEFLAGWFADPLAHPFVILQSGARAGFALVSRPLMSAHPRAEFRMAEFFVVVGARRHGVGASAAALLFTRFAGEWEVLEDEHNRPALLFWRRVISRLTGGRYAESRLAGEVRHRFRIDARPAVGPA